MFIRKDHDAIGWLYSVAFPLVSFAIFIWIEEKGIKISRSFSDILCLASVMPAFYYYLNRGMYRSVRGIVTVSILWAILYIIRFKMV